MTPPGAGSEFRASDQNRALAGTPGGQHATGRRHLILISPTSVSDPPNPPPSPPAARQPARQSRRRAALLVACVLAAAIAGYYWRNGQHNASEANAIQSLKQAGAIVVLGSKRKHADSANLSTVKPANFEAAMDNVARLYRLKSIDLSRTPLTEQHLDRVLALRNLGSVVLSGTEVGDMGVERLARLRKVEALYLVDTKITSRSADALARLKSLKILDLSRTSFNEGFDRLATLPNLEWLLLRAVDLGDARLAELTKSKSLSRLSLEAATVTAESLAVLRDAKPKFSIDPP